MPKIIFKTEDKEITIDAIVGETLLEAANRSDIPLFGGCGGAGVCGTCHVFIDQEFLKKLNEPALEELDLIDVLPNGNSNSRLACQITITEDLDGMVVTIP